MNKQSFYMKLAAQNIRKNRRTYFPYIITCICAVAMYYIIFYLSCNQSAGGTASAVLRIGTVVMMIFSAIFLLYTNSFLLKRRKKEFGLFSVLGMEKKHIATIIFFENLYTFLISIVLGIGFGILFSKLADLILSNLLSFSIRFTFSISGKAVFETVKLFAIIFALLLVYSTIQVWRSKPIELMHGSQTGEKEPKAKWLIAVLGLISLGAGYWISVSTKNPLSAFFMFLVAVVLVIIGTYLLFVAGSIALIKLLKKSTKYYYKPNHFISVSGMMYRMKQNAAGLATICILSTMVLVMISSTAALYFGMEDSLQKRYPRDIIFSHSVMQSSDASVLENALFSAIEESGAESENLTTYRTFPVTAERNGDSYIMSAGRSYTGNEMEIYVVPLEDYTALSGESISLAENEALLFTGDFAYGADSVTILGKTFSVTERGESLSSFQLSSAYNSAINSEYTLVVKDVDIISDMQDAFLEETDNIWYALFYYQVGFDVADGYDEVQLYYDAKTALLNAAKENMPEENHISYFTSSRELSRMEFCELYGGLFFLGIFLGFVFMLATAMIIYYKQVSEGYDDQKQYEIMKKVGLSRRESKRAINSQLLTMFALPLLAACVHIAFAFPALSKMLAVLNLNNHTLFILTTLLSIAIFAVFYAVIYKLTTRVYAKLVNQ